MLLTGCSYVPSINVLGAYFPGWLFCMAGGIVLTGVVHLTFHFIWKEDGLGMEILAIIYCALAITFALAGWIIFFRN